MVDLTEIFKEIDELNKRRLDLRKVIASVQEICDHTWICDGHDSHKNHYKCTKCRKTDSY